MTTEPIVCSAREALHGVTRGASVAIGGALNVGHPMALVRALLQAEPRDLTVIAGFGGLDVDMAVGYGIARRLIAAFMGAEGVAPLPPAVRWAVETGRVEAWDIDEGILLTALQAAADRLPFSAWTSGIGTAAAENPLVEPAHDDAAEVPYLRIRPLEVDVALLWAEAADPTGNVLRWGPDFGNEVLALARHDRRSPGARRRRRRVPGGRGRGAAAPDAGMSGFDPLYVAALAREMRDGEAVHVGAAQDDVWLAVRLARSLWARPLRVVAAGTFVLDGAGTMPPTVPRTYTRDVVAGRDASFQQSRVFNDLRRSRVAFAGGMQVDARGNAHLVGIYQDEKLIVRGPGSGGLPTLTSHTERFFIAVRHHSARVLVERVSRISVLGDPAARAAAGLPPHALRAVITPLARFKPSAAGLQLVEVS